MASRKTRRSAFVPRLLVPTAIASVVPACALGCASAKAPATVDSGFSEEGVAFMGFVVAAMAFGPDSGPPVATLCGDPVCPPLPGEDASADGSMADGAGGSDSAPSDAAVSDADGSSDGAASGDAPGG